MTSELFLLDFAARDFDSEASCCMLFGSFIAVFAFREGFLPSFLSDCCGVLGVVNDPDFGVERSRSVPSSLSEVSCAKTKTVRKVSMRLMMRMMMM